MIDPVLLLGSLVSVFALNRLLGDLWKQVIFPDLRRRFTPSHVKKKKKKKMRIKVKTPKGTVRELSVPNPKSTPLNEDQIRQVIKVLSEAENGRAETETLQRLSRRILWVQVLLAAAWAQSLRPLRTTYQARLYGGRCSRWPRPS